MALSDTEAAPLDGLADDFHYASLYLAPPARARCRALEAWRREVAAIPQTVSDRGVAHVKLGWWREELDRLADGVPRHPLTRTLAELDAVTPALLAMLRTFVDRVEDGLLEARLDTRAAVLGAIAELHGELLTHFALAEAAPGANELAELLQLGALCELAYELRGLRRHRRGGPLYLASATLAAQGLGIEDVRSARTSAELAAIVPGELQTTLADIETALHALPRAMRRRHSLFSARARLAAAALRLTLADGCQVLERRVELLPAHKLWLAWRSRYLG